MEEALKAYTTYPDTISPQIKEGLADLRYQTGFLGSNYPKLLKAVAIGDLNAIKQESKVKFYDTKARQRTYDTKRYNDRLRNYFHYHNGGKLIPRRRFRNPIEEFKHYS